MWFFIIENSTFLTCRPFHWVVILDPPPWMLQIRSEIGNQRPQKHLQWNLSISNLQIFEFLFPIRIHPLVSRHFYTRQCKNTSKVRKFLSLFRSFELLKSIKISNFVGTTKYYLVVMMQIRNNTLHNSYELKYNCYQYTKVKNHTYSHMCTSCKPCLFSAKF